MKTKVLYIISDKNFGGGSRHVFDLVTNLNKNKFELVLITDHSKIYDVLKNKIPVYPVDMKSIIDLNSIKKIQKIVAKEKPDIIHLHSTRAGIMGTLAAKNFNIPIIYTEHLFTNDYVPQNKIIYLLQIKTFKQLSKNIFKVIAVSNAVKKYLVDKKIFPSDKVEVIYHGVKISDKQKAISDKQKKKIIIGSVGTLTNIKGYKYLIEALKIVNSTKIENWKLEIIGTGPDESELKTLVRNFHLENNIKFLGQKNNIYDVMKNWDIYDQPSLSESFGLAAAEAMGMGIPAIVSDVGGMKELVDEKSGIKVEPKNSKSLASAIIKLADDEKLRIKFGQNARVRIEKYFSLNTMIDKTEKLYQKILN